MPNATFRRWTADDIAKLKNMRRKSRARTLRHNSVALSGRPL